jgi:hypothetical protein
MASGKFHRHGIFDSAVGEDTMKKSITKTVDRMLNPCAFDKIDTDAKHAHESSAPLPARLTALSRQVPVSSR